MEDKDKPVPDVHVAVGSEAVDEVIELSGAMITELNLPPAKSALTIDDLRIRQPEQEIPHQSRKQRRYVNSVIKRVQRRHDRKNSK